MHEMDRSEIKIGDTVTLKSGLYGAGNPMVVIGLPLTKLVRCKGAWYGDSLEHADNLVRVS